MNIPQITQLLQKPTKSTEDAYHIYEIIHTYPFFESFFAQYLKSFDFNSILCLLQTLTYQSSEAGKLILGNTDALDNQYVILSGQVALVSSSDLGNEIGSLRYGKSLLYAYNTKNSWTVKDILTTMNTEEIELDGLNTIEETPDEVSEQEVIFSECIDEVVFENYASKFGKTLNYIGPGQAFGDLSSQTKDDKKPKAICRTNCEFMVIPRHSFEAILIKKEKEKNNFIRDVFPFINTTECETLIPSHLLSCFKVETFAKGFYITVEGKLKAPKEPKVFVIHQGECLVEKTIILEATATQSSPRHRHNMQTIQITKVGPGMVVGEEILTSKDRYDYNVRPISENVIVYSILTSDLEIRSLQDFHNHLIQTFSKKKKQREITFENARKDLEAKIEQTKNENGVSSEITNIRHLIAKNAAQGLNKQVNRDQQQTAVKNWSLSHREALSPSHRVDSNDFSRKITNDRNLSPLDLKIPKEPIISEHLSPRDKTFRKTSLGHFQNKQLNLKLEHISKIQKLPKLNHAYFGQKPLDQIRLFEIPSMKKSKRTISEIKEQGKSPSNRKLDSLDLLPKDILDINTQVLTEEKSFVSPILEKRSSLISQLSIPPDFVPEPLDTVDSPLKKRPIFRSSKLTLAIMNDDLSSPRSTSYARQMSEMIPKSPVKPGRIFKKAAFSLSKNAMFHNSNTLDFEKPEESVPEIKTARYGPTIKLSDPDFSAYMHKTEPNVIEQGIHITINLSKEMNDSMGQMNSSAMMRKNKRLHSMSPSRMADPPVIKKKPIKEGLKNKLSKIAAEKQLDCLKGFSIKMTH